EHRAQVHVDHPLEVFVGLRLCGGDLRDAGVVHQHVEPSTPDLDRGVDQVTTDIVVGDVGGHRYHPVAELAHELVEGISSAGSGHHRGSGGVQHLGEPSA